MPKFGKIWFNGGYFGRSVLAPSNQKNSIRRIPLGFHVRKVFRVSNWRGVKDTTQALIFRMRRGNGYFGARAGTLYQDKMKYYVPPSINNAKGQAARDAFATAVSNWQTVLTEEQKERYNHRAARGLHMSGYNLYIREYVKANA